MSQKDYVITHGSIKQGGAYLGIGEVLSLDSAEAAKLDPQGSCLLEKSKHEAKKRAAAAAQAELERIVPSVPSVPSAAKGGKP